MDFNVCSKPKLSVVILTVISAPLSFFPVITQGAYICLLKSAFLINNGNHSLGIAVVACIKLCDKSVAVGGGRPPVT
jgi:hypothetical protein